MSKPLHPLLLPGEGITEALERQGAEIGQLCALVNSIMGPSAPRLRSQQEIEELKAAIKLMPNIEEVERLQAEMARLSGIIQFSANASRQEREGLQAEVERLRAGIREYACTGTDHPCGCYNEFLSEKVEIERLLAENKRMRNIIDGLAIHADDARRAMEQKP